ncbi:BBE domain-containing protein [Actinoplanes couchii]|uniref:Berberine/berberine-like domain-containing protein n=1 Tax=Actinoplanes couchii TaxID=403638 RepID=A0ABQ3XUA7_9ACTN|nr:BBE domain-containing protein [Actinoplanes couchii]MDR6318510.1 hypothetical protein [Actinoplanes couchii]GID61957.1 hypothetical protein Aco03nite_103610 [Actinoplanes couchii]
MVDALASWSTGRRYLNFMFTGEDAALAFPTESWNRLAGVKHRYDPDNLFRINHNITPTVWKHHGGPARSGWTGMVCSRRHPSRPQGWRFQPCCVAEDLRWAVTRFIGTGGSGFGAVLGDSGPAVPDRFLQRRSDPVRPLLERFRPGYGGHLIGVGAGQFRHEVFEFDEPAVRAEGVCFQVPYPDLEVLPADVVLLRTGATQNAARGMSAITSAGP